MESLEALSDRKMHHELFVSGHNGTDVLEISLVASTAPLSLLFFKIVMLVFSCSKTRFLKQFLLEFIILVGFVLLSLTKLADHSAAFLGFIVVCCMTIVFLAWQDKRTIHVEVIGDDESFCEEVINLQRVSSNRPEYVTNYRAYVNVATSLCILAVDFQVFPRRFCKTETFGTGLMDIGVGSFIVSNGIISREARGYNQRSGIKHLLKTIASTWPLLLLGISRVIALKLIVYQEHVSEYGVHWNFFFTLAFIRIFSSIIFGSCSPKHSLFIALLITGAYEVLLQFTELPDYLLTEGNRVGFFHSNREGIWSCIGYMALYLVSVKLGEFLFNDEIIKHSHHKVNYRDLMLKLLKFIILDGVLWMSLYQYQYRVSLVSRRMANLPYVIWMVAYNIQMLVSFLCVDIVTSFIYDWMEKDGTNATILEAINENGLVFFLFSNLLTGIVNVFIDTIKADDITALGVVASYMLCLSVVISLLHYFKIKVKFW